MNRIISLLGAVASLNATASPVFIDEPSEDRWFYPYNSTAGERAQASTFSSLPQASDVDDRFGIFLIGFDTSAVIPAGLAPEKYRIRSLTFTAVIGQDDAFAYDPSYDSIATYATPTTPESEMDSDSGRPLELHGVGFRNSWTASSFDERSAHGSSSPGQRNAYPLGFDAGGLARDVSSNVSEGYEAIPWAIGQTDELEAGDLVPEETTFTFTIDTTLPGTATYLQQGLAEGKLWFALSSLHPATQQGGEFVAWLTRDDAIHQLLGGLAPTLTLEVDYNIPLTLVRNGNSSSLSWPEFSGFTHSLRASHTPGDWSAAPIHSHDAITDGIGGFTEVTTEKRRFYQLEILPSTP
ncbi:hypothetical protein ACFQY0_18980 [Haloferula chungangensis]|uniref:Uncharacterized protein n=1 Tax=Haloferula chungangensis TaxID=1048331 RepID=A0ABW2LDS7_9BACT